MKHKRTFFLTVLFILFIFADQLTKYIIRSSGGFYICNKGVAFGISLPIWLILMLVISLVCFLGLLIINLKFQISNQFSNSKIKNFKFNSNFKFQISNFPIILLLSGALSNLFDRLHYGCVIDFIDLKFWPVFNLADIFICLGVFLLIIKFKE